MQSPRVGKGAYGTVSAAGHDLSPTVSGETASGGQEAFCPLHPLTRVPLDPVRWHPFQPMKSSLPFRESSSVEFRFNNIDAFAADPASRLLPPLLPARHDQIVLPRRRLPPDHHRLRRPNPARNSTSTATSEPSSRTTASSATASTTSPARPASDSDTTEGATLKLESGAQAIVPGDPDASSLIARLTSTNPDEVMPPPASGKKVTPEQIEILKRWIREGAEFKSTGPSTPSNAPLFLRSRTQPGKPTRSTASPSPGSKAKDSAPALKRTRSPSSAASRST